MVFKNRKRMIQYVGMLVLSWMVSLQQLAGEIIGTTTENHSCWPFKTGVTHWNSCTWSNNLLRFSQCLTTNRGSCCHGWQTEWRDNRLDGRLKQPFLDKRIMSLKGLRDRRMIIWWRELKNPAGLESKETAAESWRTVKEDRYKSVLGRP